MFDIFDFFVLWFDDIVINEFVFEIFISSFFCCGDGFLLNSLI